MHKWESIIGPLIIGAENGKPGPIQCGDKHYLIQGEQELLAYCY